MVQVVSCNDNSLSHVYENFFLKEFHNELLLYYWQHITVLLN